LIVARFRYHLHTKGTDESTILCEEIVPLAFSGSPETPLWLSPEDGEQLLMARPERNLVQTAIDQQLEWLLPALPALQSALAPVASERACVQLEAHERVREASRAKGRVTIEPVLPVDVLGAFILLPKLS
jgi:hypothetical protein